MPGFRSGWRLAMPMLLSVLSSCTSPKPGEWRGAALPAPVERPSFTLQDTNGRPFEFATETTDRLALLFFGYASCPDVCPVHMANLAAVLERQPFDVRSRVVVVFVSTDPVRDSPARIRAWLDGFDSSFIGLTGDLAEVNRIQASLGLPSADPGEPRGDGEYDIGHAASVLAFPPGGPAMRAYPFGTRQADWEHDLPRLLRGDAQQ